MENKRLWIIFLALPFILFGLSHEKNILGKNKANKELLDSSFNLNKNNKEKLKKSHGDVQLNENGNNQNVNGLNEDYDEQDLQELSFKLKNAVTNSNDEALYHKVVVNLGPLNRTRLNFNIIKYNLEQLNIFINRKLFDLHWDRQKDDKPLRNYTEDVKEFYNQIIVKSNELEELANSNVYHYSNFIRYYKQVLNILNKEKNITRATKTFYYEAMRLLKENIGLFHANQKTINTIKDFLKYMEELGQKFKLTTEPAALQTPPEPEMTTLSTEVVEENKTQETSQSSYSSSCTKSAKNGQATVNNENNSTYLIIVASVVGVLLLGAVGFVVYKRKLAVRS